MCPISGKELMNDNNTHIDHNYETLPFAKMVKDFCKTHDYDIKSIQTVSQGTNRTFTDENVQHKWLEYHYKHAQLRALHKNANMSANTPLHPPVPQQIPQIRCWLERYVT